MVVTGDEAMYLPVESTHPALQAMRLPELISVRGAARSVWVVFSAHRKVTGAL